MFAAPRLPHLPPSVARSQDSRSLSSVGPSPGSSAPPPGPSPSAALCSRRSVCPCAGQSTGARSAQALLPQQPRAQHILVPHLVPAQAMQAPHQVQVPPTQAPAFQVPHHPPYPPPQVILVQVLVSQRQASRLMLPVQLPVPPQCQRPIITARPSPLGLVIVHLPPPPPPQASPPLPYPLQITTIMALP